VTKLSIFGASLVYSTYLGGDSDEVAWGIFRDAPGNVYVTGITASGNGSGATNFPIAGNSIFQKAFGGGIDAFITKFGDHTICGRITTGAGVPVGGVTVTLSGALSATVQTDAQGFYAFLDTVSSGALTVTPTLQGYTFTPPNKGVPVLNDNKVFNFTRN
jgi:hypothetical protein